MRLATPVLTFDIASAVGVLTLQRADKRNALNDELIDAIDDTLANLPDEVKALVLRGAGDHFCAGLDLSERLSKPKRSPIEGVRHSRRWHAVFDRLQYSERPVVAVLQGGVIGGGLELAAACHVRVAERSAFYQLPEAQRGIFVGGGGSVRIPRIIGSGRVVAMMLTAMRYDAAEGQSLGLSHYLVDDGAGAEKAMGLAQQIAGNAPLSNYVVINAVARIQDMASSDGCFAEAMVGSLTRASLDGDQRIAAFLEERRNRAHGAGTETP